MVSGLVELAGPAGAGKSSVFRTLSARAANVDGEPILRRGEYAPLLATTVPGVLGTLVRRRVKRRLTRQAIGSMVYLSTLPHVVERRASGEANMLVFDQGPLFLLSQAQIWKDDRLAAWRQKTLDTWGSLLDVIVWLDAPDAVLAERINTRSEWHRLKGARPETAIDVLGEARAAYRAMISSLAQRDDGPAILRFDTSRASTEEVVDAVLGGVEGFATTIRSDPPPEPVFLPG